MNYKFEKVMKEEIFYAGHIEEMKDKEKLMSLYSKKFDYSLGGYSHRERWSRMKEICPRGK
jgi:hypothetical protein